jgi:hypothetical protein
MMIMKGDGETVIGTVASDRTILTDPDEDK